MRAKVITFNSNKTMQQVTITRIRFNPCYKINIQSRTLHSVGTHCVSRDDFMEYTGQPREQRNQNRNPNTAKKRKKKITAPPALHRPQYSGDPKEVPNTQTMFFEESEHKDLTPYPLPLVANNQSLSQSAMNHMAHRRQV